jgi:hypothetical protein
MLIFYVKYFDLACINYRILATAVSSRFNQPEQSEIVHWIVFSYYEGNNNNPNLMNEINGDQFRFWQWQMCVIYFSKVIHTPVNESIVLPNLLRLFFYFSYKSIISNANILQRLSCFRAVATYDLYNLKSWCQLV